VVDEEICGGRDKFVVDEEIFMISLLKVILIKFKG